LIAQLAMEYRLPTMYSYRFFVESGGLASYGPGDDTNLAPLRPMSIAFSKEQAARPAGAPATRFPFVLNLKTARAIGLDISPSVLALVDEVIE